MTTLIRRGRFPVHKMGTLEQMPVLEATCDDCGSKYRVREWPDGELRALENDGRCDCGSLSFHRTD